VAEGGKEDLQTNLHSLRRSHLHFFYYQWLPSFPCHSSYRLSKLHQVIARHKWEIQIHKMTTAHRTYHRPHKESRTFLVTFATYDLTSSAWHICFCLKRTLDPSLTLLWLLCSVSWVVTRQVVFGGIYSCRSTHISPVFWIMLTINLNIS